MSTPPSCSKWPRNCTPLETSTASSITFPSPTLKHSTGSKSFFLLPVVIAWFTLIHCITHTDTHTHTHTHTHKLTELPLFTCRSWSGYGDELLWGALWLYRATEDKSYLTKAQAAWDEFGLGEGAEQFSWDDKKAGAYVSLPVTKLDYIHFDSNLNMR